MDEALPDKLCDRPGIPSTSTGGELLRMLAGLPGS